MECSLSCIDLEHSALHKWVFISLSSLVQDLCMNGLICTLLCSSFETNLWTSKHLQNAPSFGLARKHTDYELVQDQHVPLGGSWNQLPLVVFSDAQNRPSANSPRKCFFPALLHHSKKQKLSSASLTMKNSQGRHAPFFLGNPLSFLMSPSSSTSLPLKKYSSTSVKSPGEGLLHYPGRLAKV